MYPCRYDLSACNSLCSGMLQSSWLAPQETPVSECWNIFCSEVDYNSPRGFQVCRKGRYLGRGTSLASSQVLQARSWAEPGQRLCIPGASRRATLIGREMEEPARPTKGKKPPADHNCGFVLWQQIKLKTCGRLATCRHRRYTCAFCPMTLLIMRIDGFDRPNGLS